MQSTAKTVQAYLESLPDSRRAEMENVRNLILKHLPAGYTEGMQYGMVSYYIPLEKFPDTYNGQPLSYVALASQKNYISLYLMGVYGKKETSFREAWRRTSKKLDMGKSCIRFKKAEDLAGELIGKAIAEFTPEQFIAAYKHTRKRDS
jgi:uncharacterized protein DUF1801